jgi:carbon monoxide dehydrogenase subunit G
LDLTHKFSVPTGIDETWAHFNDIASVAECFPGATVNSVEEDTFTGSCKVRLGPIALVYNGSGTFVEKDDAAHRFVVEAKGKDKRGNGTAGAHVTVSMADTSGSTDVEVVTDLSITGKPAQFGRGVMQDVSDKLLGQFVACLETRLAGTDTEPSGEPGAGDQAAAASAAAGAAEVAPDPTPPTPTKEFPHGPIDDTSAGEPAPGKGRRDRPRRHRPASPGEELLETGARCPRHRGADHLVDRPGLMGHCRFITGCRRNLTSLGQFATGSAG